MEHFTLDFFTKENHYPLFIQYGKHDDTMPLHDHLDFCELSIVLEGHAMHIIGEEQYPISKGDVFIIGEHTSHSFEKAENFKLCNIMFRFSDFFPPDYDIWQLPGFHALFVIEPFQTNEEGFQSHLRLAPSSFAELRLLLDQLKQEYDTQAPGWQTMVTTAFTRLALGLSRLYQTSTIAAKSDLMRLIQPITYIETNYMDDITSEQLADLTSLSIRQTNRLFQRVYQLSPIAYLLQVRLQKASQQLLHTSLSISEIAFHCGFNDSNYFSRQFRNFTGMSPREYRKFSASARPSITS